MYTVGQLYGWVLRPQGPYDSNADAPANMTPEIQNRKIITITLIFSRYIGNIISTFVIFEQDILGLAKPVSHLWPIVLKLYIGNQETIIYQLERERQTSILISKFLLLVRFWRSPKVLQRPPLNSPSIL